MSTTSDITNCEDQLHNSPLSHRHNDSQHNDQVNSSNVIQWINSFKFTRPKKTIARDFSDATMVAEIMKYYWPKMIDLHNYIPASALTNKISNWETLNRKVNFNNHSYLICRIINSTYLKKVLKKVKLPLSRDMIEKLSTADTNTIFQFLKSLKLVVDKIEHEKKLKLEKNQHFPVYIIANDDMIQVPETDCYTNEYLKKEVVQLINKLKHQIADMEHKIDHMSSLISVKDRRINELLSQLNQKK